MKDLRFNDLTATPQDWDSQVALVVQNPPAKARHVTDMGSIPGWEDSLQEGLTTHSSILVWRISWTEVPCGLQSIRSHKIRHDWSDLAPTHKIQFSSVAQSCPILCDSMDYSTWGPSPAPEAYSNSCPITQWCHPTISSSVVPFSSCLQSFPALESFQMSQFFASSGQSIEVSE